MLFRNFRNLQLPDSRGPLRVMFIHTELVVGGAETLLAEIIRKMDREKFSPELCCLKDLEELGEILAKEIPTHSGLLRHKLDIGVIPRLRRLLKERKTDAIVTIGTGGDRMFWGRLAAWSAGVPVILSALHATGYPMKVEWMNRLLSPITDGFIGCASRHADYLVSGEKCPADKVFTVWNGVDIERFQPLDQQEVRKHLDLPIGVPIAGIVAALREEKQHTLLIDSWAKVVEQLPKAVLVVVGDGVERQAIEDSVERHGLAKNVRLLGTRHNVHELLSAFDVKVLASRMEANPASTLEANACGIPAIAPNVGSLPDTIRHGKTGLLYEANNSKALAECLVRLLSESPLRKEMGAAALELVRERFSVDVMVGGYECLIDGVYRAACAGQRYLPAEHENRMEAKLLAKAEEAPSRPFSPDLTNGTLQQLSSLQH
ncbi:MAG: glycosyltransferase [Pirellulaceae bacterium]